ncbi:FHA domain-containing protein [Herbiconiux sp. KACC 21604]|uniref:FHA domain-containing protein FhaB/FipA n=1 Tax=unclassified Herbiconiux TaxID=2618217 RepID=UPI001490F2B2|nr:FHA domain-containing protein [Herbiconiux sp. SALV-R1]QJU55493.1 FHA domain-containing protein [Herbiconiux sp. SALV-R1]WPO86677.1 FHA domain-containing protein [Herbiconiux sp. KACC 21604]
MSELTLLILQLAFLALLWVFIFIVVYAMRSDLFGQRVRKLKDAPAAAGAAPNAPAPNSANAANTAAASAAAAAAAAPAAPPPPAPKVPTFVPVAGTELSGPPRATTTNAGRLVITSGTKSGSEIALGAEPLTIGRSSDSSVVIRDDYTSTHHARLMIWGDEWVIQDLDSTNGTFLDGVRVTAPVHVPLNTPIRIGATSFELRR